jgi:hypothetical protein
VFARYSVLGALCAAVGALAAGLPGLVTLQFGIPHMTPTHAFQLSVRSATAAIQALDFSANSEARVAVEPLP